MIALLPYLLLDHRQQIEFEHELFAEGATIAVDLRRTPDDIWRSYDRHLRQALRRLSTMENECDAGCGVAAFR